MDYTEFREKLLGGLRNFYGDSAEVELLDVQKNNGIRYDGIQIKMKGGSPKIARVIRVEELYGKCSGGGMDMERCIQAVSEMQKNSNISKNVEEIAEKVKNWDYVKKTVFPILLSTERNLELLQKLPSMQVLDLSVAYIIRVQTMEGGVGSVKINKNMLEVYGISIGQLHKQAMENLRRDGYGFQDMESLIESMTESKEAEGACKGTQQEAMMYVLTNTVKTYGAAGILDKELLKGFAGEQDYYILPSSIHETIFVPVHSGFDKKDLDSMVAEINADRIDPEERLTDHSYYYDAGTGEIRMCA